MTLQDLPRSSPIGDGAMVDRLIRMRAACHALAVELASTRRELRATEAELRKLRERQKRDLSLSR